MRDENYIPAEKRGEWRADNKHEPGQAITYVMTNVMTNGMRVIKALDSHAVADDVMRELAEALRPLVQEERYNLPPCREEDTGACYVARECVSGCGTDEAWERYCKHRAAIARYDALTKETNDD